jgi:hypothetical protein
VFSLPHPNAFSKLHLASEEGTGKKSAVASFIGQSKELAEEAQKDNQKLNRVRTKQRQSE